jgi:molybdate transport system substrate-binding protein
MVRMTSSRSWLAVGIFCFAAQGSWAQQAPVHLLVSNGMKAVVEALQPQIEKKIGHSLAMDYGSTTGLMQKVDQGAAFDVAILTSEGVDELVKKGKVPAASRADFARCGIGLAVKSGTSKPDIATPESLKKTLEAAASITYAGDGASRPSIDHMLERLGIAQKVKSKVILTKGSGAAMASVAEGRVAVVMTLISELMPVKGIDIVGPLPGDLQNYVRFGAGVGGSAAQPAAARALIAFLGTPEAAPVYKSKGMEAIRK